MLYIYIYIYIHTYIHINICSNPLGVNRRKGLMLGGFA